MAHRIFLAFAGGLLLSSPVLAQTAPAIPNPPPPPAQAAPAPQAPPPSVTKSPPASMTQSPPASTPPAASMNAPSSGALAQADARFVSEATAAGMAEVEMGRLAATKAASPGVKQFGEMMVNDHGKANAELQLRARQATGAASMTPEHQRTHDRLAGLSGNRFDRRYITIQVREHEKAIQLFERQASSGQDPQLRQFAADKLPTLKQHLQMAQSLSASMQPPAQSRLNIPPAQPRLNNTAPASGGNAARATRESREAYTADQLNEAELQRVRNASTGNAGMAAAGMPRGTGPCAPAKSPESASRAATAPGSQPDTTRSPDANLAEQRMRAAGYC